MLADHGLPRPLLKTKFFFRVGFGDSSNLPNECEGMAGKRIKDMA
jgi:hypothetical protein